MESLYMSMSNIPHKMFVKILFLHFNPFFVELQSKSQVWL